MPRQNCDSQDKENVPTSTNIPPNLARKKHSEKKRDEHKRQKDALKERRSLKRVSSSFYLLILYVHHSNIGP